jgi:hypothetical protein
MEKRWNNVMCAVSARIINIHPFNSILFDDLESLLRFPTQLFRKIFDITIKDCHHEPGNKLCREEHFRSQLLNFHFPRRSSTCGFA